MIPIESYFKTYGPHNGFRFLPRPSIRNATDRGAGRSARAAALLPPPAARSRTTTFTHVRLGHHRQPPGNSLTGAIAAMAVGIVSVFMVVGGIVIMNIMLAVVTERTHEIGIRKSLGARRARHPESVSGGIVRCWPAIGGLIGVIMAWLRRGAGAQHSRRCRWRCLYSSVVIGVGLSAAVGLFFGIYPARQASKLDPIEALRVEK